MSDVKSEFLTVGICEYMKKKVMLRILLTTLSVAAVAAIFYHSSLSADASTVESDSVLDAVNAFLRSIHLNITLDEFLIRKTAHFVEYFVLGALLMFTVISYLSQHMKSFALALTLGLSVAVTDELIQTFSEGRSCELRDMLLDFSGVLLSSLMILLIFTLIFRHRRKVSD